MSTELSNGVIIPEEYSDDWYDEMSINLRKLNDVITAASDNATDIQRLDTDKANQSDLTALSGRVSQNETDIIALQTAVSGALKREIVQTLPTEDISTTTIYMIRNSQSSGTNIYDEYMYINSQWELIGTSATDFSNYYTKNESDNLLSAKANQTDLTALTSRVSQNETDITALQTAVSGALKREIVQSLPTQDISTTTIYMIRNTTTSGDNIYDEYMYINNLWELIGTSATDLTNYYTKAEVDGKLLLKASASDLTSHTGNTTIHVTTADKNKWNNQTYVFRYSSTALTASSTNSNTLLDNTNNLKVGDKVIDSSGVLFSITAIDTQNSTFTIGTALIDLAQDSDVVHKSGDETISGSKTFLDVPIPFKSSTAELGVTGGNTKVIFTDKNLLNLAGITLGNYGSSKLSYCRFHIYDKDSNNQEVENFIEFSYVNNNQIAYFRPNKSDFVTLGTVNNRWSKVYANEYYYGSNNVEFSTKFVTTNTNQTISGNKTFSSINGVEPSSLSLPSDRSARIDISSYITNLGKGNNNQYIVPANGYIWLHFTSINGALCYSQTSGGLTNYAQTFSRYQGDGQLYVFFPVRKDDYFIVQIYTASTAVVQNAFFIPCQGNV